MDVAHHASFRTPQPRHLAELRIGAAHSPVAFSAPSAAGRKRRCLLPAFSSRKKMLLELPPFFSAPAPAPSPPPATAGRASGVVSGRSGSGSFAFLGLQEQALTSAGSNNGGAFPFLASSEPPLTPMGSTASGGLGVPVPQPSLSPSPQGSSGTGAFEFLASTKPASTGSTGIGAFPFLATGAGRTGSPGPAPTKEMVPAGSAVTGGGGGLVSPSFVFSASRKSSPAPGRESRDSTLWARRRRSQQQREEQLQITLPQQKDAKTDALPTAESSRCAAPSAPTCLTSLAAEASKKQEEAKKDTLAAGDASPSPSPSGACCTFVTSPTRPPSAEKAKKQDRGVQAGGVSGEGPASPAACSGGKVVVRVTCSCGARTEFSFRQFH